MTFVDTSYWIALRYARDGRHPAARALWSGGAHRLVTTNHVVGETWTFLRMRVSHSVALTFVDQIELSRRLEIHRVSSDEEQEAWRWLRRHDERPYSFVDATSFAVMRRRRIRKALAFDGAFGAAGFIELRP